MPETTRPVLLIDHGDLPSLTAALLQPDTSRLILWHPMEPGPAGDRRGAIAQEHAALLGTRGLLVAPEIVRPGVASLDPELVEVLLLVHAAVAARDHGCTKIIWPVQGEIDPNTVCRRVDRATGVTDLADVSPRPTVTAMETRAPPSELVIDLPLVDLDDDQVVDLADDVGAPWAAFWPCDHGDAHPCGTCEGCQRWRTAFERRGLTTPWLTPGSVGASAPAPA